MPCLAAASGPGYAYGPATGTATGIVMLCSAAEVKAEGWNPDPDPSRVVIVSAQNQAGKIVASQRLPLRTSGTRYRMRLLAGTYSINISTPSSDGYEFSGDWEFVPADEADELDFNDSVLDCVW